MKNDKHEEHLTPDERSVGPARGIETILVFTDFSDNGTAAVRRAAQLAAQHGSDLRIVHVVTPVPLSPVQACRHSDDARARTAHAKITLAALAAHATAHHSIRVNTQVLAGTLLDEILRESAAGDLLVLGARGWVWSGARCWARRRAVC